MDHLRDILSAVEIGEPTARHNLSVFPLFGPVHRDPDYITLDEAINSRHSEITEVSDEGTVAEIRFSNSTDRPILVVDGEELVGAKQNRIVNLTLLVPAKSAVVIPVSCVEAGRWSASSACFESGERIHYGEARALKTAQVNSSMARSGQAMSDQGAIWDHLGDKMARMEARSATGASEALYESQRAHLDDLVRGLSVSERQTGAIFVISGSVAGVEMFDRDGSLAKLFSKLVRSYGLDAIDRADRPHEVAKDEVCKAFLALISRGPAQTYDAPFIGQDLRFSSEGLVGAALVAEGHVVHLCAFAHRPHTGRGSARERSPTMRHASARADNHRRRRNGDGD